MLQSDLWGFGPTPEPTRKTRMIKTKDHLAEFEAANPDIAQWWNNSIWDFAQSLKAQVAKGRTLSEKQLQVARDSIQRTSVRKVAAPKAVSVNVEYVVEAMSRARGSILRPKMRLMGLRDQKFTLSMAPAYGANAGSIYVTKDQDEYIGKITDGLFIRRDNCTAADEASLVAAFNDPEASAIAYGQRYGNCSICDRTLTNAESIRLGIGPICRGRFFG